MQFMLNEFTVPEGIGRTTHFFTGLTIYFVILVLIIGIYYRTLIEPTILTSRHKLLFEELPIAPITKYCQKNKT